jgi:hypothetical protein
MYTNSVCLGSFSDSNTLSIRDVLGTTIVVKLATVNGMTFIKRSADVGSIAKYPCGFTLRTKSSKSAYNSVDFRGFHMQMGYFMSRSASTMSALQPRAMAKYAVVHRYFRRTSSNFRSWDIKPKSVIVHLSGHIGIQFSISTDVHSRGLNNILNMIHIPI